MAGPVLRLLAPDLDGASVRPSVWLALLSGAGLGFLWGVAARVWMRLISTRPEFTVAGTMAIIGIAVLFGLWVGLGFAARRRGWSGWRHWVPRTLVVLFFLPFGFAGGGPLMLTVLLVTLAVAQPVGRGWVRRSVQAVLLLPAAWLVGHVAREILPGKALPLALLYIALYLLLLVPLHLGLRVGLARRSP